MGITQVGSGETEGFEEGLDLEYHDAAEHPNVLEPEGNMRESVLSHGGCGSSSLRKRIELLNNPERKAPATCHSGPKMENRSGPSQEVHLLNTFLQLLTSDIGLSESMEVTPIPSSSSSPSILHNPLQVMSPNLVAGSASADPPPMREMETEAGVQASTGQWNECTPSVARRGH